MWYLLIAVPLLLLAVWLGLRLKNRPATEELQRLDESLGPICLAACVAPISADFNEVNIAQLNDSVPQNQKARISNRAEISYIVIQSDDAFIHLAKVIQTTDGSSDALAFNLCLKLMQATIGLIKRSLGEECPSLSVGGVGTKAQGLQFCLSTDQQQQFQKALTSRETT